MAAARVLQVADSILEKLTKDTLPGVNAAKVADLKTLRDAYAAAYTDQGGRAGQGFTACCPNDFMLPVGSVV